MNKHIRFLASALAAMLLFAGCSSKEASGTGEITIEPVSPPTEQSGQSGDAGNTQAGKQPDDANGAQTAAVSGIITAVGTDTVTVAVNPAGGASPGGAPGNGPEKGTQGEKPDAQASGSIPSQPSSAEPGTGDGGAQGQPREGFGGEVDTSGWESATYKIDDQTEIKIGQPGASAEADADISSLEEGVSVSITPRSEDETVAETIIVMSRQSRSATPPAQ